MFRSIIKKTAHPIHTFQPSAYFSSVKFKDPNKLPMPTSTVDAPFGALKPGYQKLSDRLKSLNTQSKIASVLTPVVSAGWLFATDQALLASPVALSALIVGGAFIANRVMQMVRIKKYANLSIMTKANGPTTSPDMNHKIQEMIAGPKPTISLTRNGLFASGLVGDLKNPSDVKEKALAEIQSMNRIPIPASVLTQAADKAVDLTVDRWLARINVPFAILNILVIASKNSKDRTPDDYVTFAAASYSIYDYFSGKSVKEARQQFTDLLFSCKTPQGILKVLIDHDVIDEGGMSFLNEWVKTKSSIAVRVGRTGTPILYGNKSSSFGGPYPIQVFPKQDHSITPRPSN